jgi:hypothetical protein
MTRIKYRIVKEITPNGQWDPVGVVALWESDPPHMQLRSMLAHTVSRPIWRAIGERVDERRLTLETFHLALGEYERYYHILPEIWDLEAETAAELRRAIRERFVFKQDMPLVQAVPA